ncbi:unnamed protein product [Heligmosomoides polygyrus]|uniref:Uncharacterized protein n=1 Tax=Heligmosomoides polygyrus TaxID=6339 RepID=A0A183FA49_HELPZ|nr:unnamed protein product [Heligmosomoides polygyrus]
MDQHLRIRKHQELSKLMPLRVKVTRRRVKRRRITRNRRTSWSFPSSMHLRRAPPQSQRRRKSRKDAVH